MRIARTVILLLAALAPSGCQIAELVLPKSYAGPAALPPELAEPFAYTPSPIEPALEEVAVRRTMRHLKGRFEAPDPTTGEASPVQFQLFLSKVGQGRRPVVALMPILGGSYGVSKMIAEELVQKGLHAFIVHREQKLLDGDNDPADIARIMRRALVNTRRTLDWVVQQPEVDPDRIGLVGVSLGAIAGSVLCAVEPRIGRAVLVMGGGDIPGIACDSHEQPVHRYKIARMDRLGLLDDAAFRESMRPFPLDPLHYGPYVDARNVLQIVTTLDNRVPTPYQWKLWEALGRPAGYAIPIGHYSMALHVSFALKSIERWLGEGFEPKSPKSLLRPIDE